MTSAMVQNAEPTLFDTEQYAISGVISRITPDGCSAVARLDHTVDGLELVVISFQSRGRVNLINKGLFKIGAKIRFSELRRVPDGFEAVAVLPV